MWKWLDEWMHCFIVCFVIVGAFKIMNIALWFVTNDSPLILPAMIVTATIFKVTGCLKEG